MTRPLGRLLVVCVAIASAATGRAESGSDLWLRYDRVNDPAQLRTYRQAATAIILQNSSPTVSVIAVELMRGLRGLLGVDVPVATAIRKDGAVVVGTPSQSPVIAALGWHKLKTERPRIAKALFYGLCAIYFIRFFST